jgi:hypothetical protein
MNITEIAVSVLKPYPKNTKKHDETQIANVAQSIKEYGFVQPVVIDKNNEVVIGHCRLLAAKQLGMETVPSVSVDELTEEQVKALRIVDNKTNESPWELDFLADELAEIDLGEFDFGFGVDMGTFDENFDESNLDEEVTKENVTVSINCKNVSDYEKIKERLQALSDEVSATMAVKRS